MELVAEFIGIDTDKGAWEYFCQHWRTLFPPLGSRSNYAKHAANLWAIKQDLHPVLAKQLGAYSDRLHIADGLPMPVCHFKRARRSRVLDEVATYGHCASKEETYYGFKGNVLISSDGVITAMTVTAAHVDERESLWELLPGIEGRVIADKGLIGAAYQQALLEQAGVDLQTTVRSNMEESRSDGFIKWLKSTRRLVETVIGQLADRFHIQNIRARKRWYLTNRIARKVLAHTVAIFINKTRGNPPLQFDLLIAEQKS